MRSLIMICLDDSVLLNVSKGKNATNSLEEVRGFVSG
jgi:hypothetical protein